jgi:hypothetical protein
MQNVLKQIIKDTIAPLFKEKGFKKKGTNFAKLFPNFAWVVNVQSSRWNTQDNIEFTMNTGIFTDKLYGTFYELEPPQFPTEITSVLRLRITELKNMSDEWYKLTPTTDTEELREQIMGDIKGVIFRHFEQFQTIEDVIKELGRREGQGWYENPHYLTILYQTSGYKDKAQNRMDKVYLECDSDSQKEFTKELAKRLGLNIK